MRATLPDGRVLQVDFYYTFPNGKRITECKIRVVVEGKAILPVLYSGVSSRNPGDPDCKETARKVALHRALGMVFQGGHWKAPTHFEPRFAPAEREAIWRAYHGRRPAASHAAP